MTTAQELILELRDAVELFDKPRAGELCERIIDDTRSGAIDLGTRQAIHVLGCLRKKRYFELLDGVAAAFHHAGLDDASLRLLRIQALIDRQQLARAERELDRLGPLPTSDPARHKALGLRGRLLKQRYVDADDSSAVADSLRSAIDAYQGPYRDAPKRNYWHGINLVACLARAEADGVTVETDVAWRTVAGSILDLVAQRAPEDGDYTWAMATALEAAVALEREDAHLWAERYIRSPLADAFELGSTARQLREVWRLDETEDPKLKPLLAILNGKLTRCAGGELELQSANEIRDLQESACLEANFGNESARSMRWLEKALKRCQAVARVLSARDESVGTGFLVTGEQLHPAWGEQPVFVTNAHVVGDPRHREAITPRQTQVRFTASGDHANEDYRVKRLLWLSPVNQHDTAILELAGLPDGVEPLGLCERDDVDRHREEPRLIVVGHPLGQELQLSLHDNRLVGYKTADNTGVHVVHYRSPTERGSSGSPVFAESWDVLALHHAAPPGVGANEGILFESIREGIRRKPPTERTLEA